VAVDQRPAAAVRQAESCGPCAGHRGAAGLAPMRSWSNRVESSRSNTGPIRS